MTDRNYKLPAYVKWRKDVAKRDHFCCQWPGCQTTLKLRFHHIKRWADYPHLRFELSNGITLCKLHHDSIWSKEEHYEKFFYAILMKPSKYPDKKNKKASLKYYKDRKTLKNIKLNIKADIQKWQREQQKKPKQ